jgi:hypothetical protein
MEGEEFVAFVGVEDTDEVLFGGGRTRRQARDVGLLAESFGGGGGGAVEGLIVGGGAFGGWQIFLEERGEEAQHIVCRGPFMGLFGEQPLNQLLQSGGIDARKRLGMLADDVVAKDDQVLARERRLQTGKMVEDAAGGPHVDLVVVRLLFDELRTEVQRGANSGALDGSSIGHDLGNAQIADLHSIV